MNPVPASERMAGYALPISADGADGIETALRMANAFAISDVDARKWLAEMLRVVEGWQGATFLTDRDRDRADYRSAFENEDIVIARKLVG